MIHPKFIHPLRRESVANALDWFTDPFWKGPRPGPDTVFEVTTVGDERRWRVRARRVMEWRLQSVA